MIMKCLALLFSLHLLSVPVGSLPCSGCSQLIRTRDARCTIPTDSLVVYEPCARIFTENSSTPCDVRVGLSLVVECTDNDAVLHWNNEPIGGNLSAFVIDFVQPEHRGVYDCRSANDTVLAERLVIVNEETQVAGGPRGTACFPFKCVEELGCCSPNNFESIAFVGQVFSFNVYGKDPEVSWETVQWRNHHGIDLKLQLITTSLTSIQSLEIGRRPKVVSTGPENPSDPTALVRVTAGNNVSTSSACFNLSFFDDATLFVNGSLPEDERVEEGRDAVFGCVMGASFSTAFDTAVHIQYELNGTVDPWLCQGFDCMCRGSCRSEITGRQVNSALLTQYSYEIRVPSVVTAENGAVVACALLNGNVTQWRGEATLTVVSATLLATPTGDTPTGDTPTGDQLQYIAVAVVLVVVILIIGVAVAVVLILRKRSGTAHGKHDLVPLRGGNVSVTPETSPLPPVVVETALLEGQPPPSITVTTSGDEVEWGMANGRSSPHSMDSGHCGSICSIDVAVREAHAPGPPVKSQRSRSLADLLSEDSKKTRIYVSYSNCKSQWVTGYLKPLMESFPGTEVTIHDADMIAGQPISVERLRLIVQADKVVIVCSPDYAQSPWCQYELYQAIAKQPSLAEGRIIPVLCDGCSCPPPEVRAVVCLSDKDKMFPHKLKAALIRLHRSSS